VSEIGFRELRGVAVEICVAAGELSCENVGYGKGANWMVMEEKDCVDACLKGYTY